MKLDEVTSDVSSQLEDQISLGISVEQHRDVPETGPANRGVWWRIPQVTAVFADLKGSTKMSATESRADAAVAYTLFIRAMAVILERFEAKYIDIQGDGIFGLFSGQGSSFLAAACATTMRTEVERTVDTGFQRFTSASSDIKAGIGVDQGTLLVRRLGLRGTKQNEVWVGKPVNVAAKLSSEACANQVVVSDRVYESYERASLLRRRALLWSCGCDQGRLGAGLDVRKGLTSHLWKRSSAPADLGLDFADMHRLNSPWCVTHGPEFCEAIVTGKRPST